MPGSLWSAPHDEHEIITVSSDSSAASTVLVDNARTVPVDNVRVLPLQNMLDWSRMALWPIMSKKLQRLEDVLLDNECGICYNHLYIRSIVMLSCNHTVCLSCVRQITNALCPFCKQRMN